MVEKRYRTVIWTFFIIFILISVSAFTFLVFWTPSGKGGAGINIAVLDSGINLDATIHGVRVSRELRNAIILQKSFVSTEYDYDTNLSVIDDTESLHGTRVALSLAGRTTGQAPEAKLIIARCADTMGTATYSSFLAAYHWAIDEGEADIINVSLGGGMLYNNTIVDAINDAAIEKGILTVVSAGNSGDALRYSTSSIEAPGDAVQAITVGALSVDTVADYSSIGPLKDHRIKPDLLDSGYFLGAIGTSFAAPGIAGKAATLMSWCHSQGYKTTPGLIKAALMQSARVNPSFPAPFGGAGLPDLEEAKNIITSTQKINSLPVISYVSPNSLPFDLSVVFSGDVWHFPLTIITSIEQRFYFSTLSVEESIVSIPSEETINQSGIVDCQLIIPSDMPIGAHSEQIIIENDFEELLEIGVEVAIEEPILRIGFDVYHSPWEIDNLFGQFKEMRRFLTDENIALIELIGPENYAHLENYDALIIPDPNSYGARINASLLSETFFRPFSNATIESIVNFVDNGGGVFVLSTTPNSSEIDETNRLLRNFNISIDSCTIPPIIISTGNGFNGVQITNLSLTHPIISGITDFDYLGSCLNVSGENAEALAWSNINIDVGGEIVEVSKAVLVAFESKTNESGRVVVTGSNFMIDNYGINHQYGSQHNLKLMMQIIEWISKTEFYSNRAGEETSISKSATKSPLPFQLSLYAESYKLSLNFSISDSQHNTIQKNLVSVSVALLSVGKRKRKLKRRSDL